MPGLYGMLGIGCDNYQAFYLTFLVYRNRKGNTEIISDSLKSTLLVNVTVSMLDWIGVAIFVAQIFWSSSTLYVSLVLQQIIVAWVGVHAALLVLVFQRLKNLTFCGRSRPALVPNQSQHTQRRVSSMTTQRI